MASVGQQADAAHQLAASPALVTEKSNMDQKEPSVHGGAAQQAASLNIDESPPVTNHPKGWKLALLAVGICLAIFLISLELVPAQQPSCSGTSGSLMRFYFTVSLSLLLQSLRSRPNSGVWKTWAGMEAVRDLRRVVRHAVVRCRPPLLTRLQPIF